MQVRNLQALSPHLYHLYPIAPCKSAPSKWTALPWIDRYSGTRYRAGATDERDAPDVVQLQTYRDVVREFRTHPEAKSAGADGQACGRRTVGLLGRRVVRESYIAHVGKEANMLEEVEAGLEHDPEVIYTEYPHLDRDEWTAVVLPGLHFAEANELAHLIGLSSRSIKTIRNGTQYPGQATRARISRGVKQLELLPLTAATKAGVSIISSQSCDEDVSSHNAMMYVPRNGLSYGSTSWSSG